MGFKVFNAMNSAHLAKQAWRAIQTLKLYGLKSSKAYITQNQILSTLQEKETTPGCGRVFYMGQI